MKGTKIMAIYINNSTDVSVDILVQGDHVV